MSETADKPSAGPVLTTVRFTARKVGPDLVLTARPSLLPLWRVFGLLLVAMATPIMLWTSAIYATLSVVAGGVVLLVIGLIRSAQNAGEGVITLVRRSLRVTPQGPDGRPSLVVDGRIYAASEVRRVEVRAVDGSTPKVQREFYPVYVVLRTEVVKLEDGLSQPKSLELARILREALGLPEVIGDAEPEPLTSGSLAFLGVAVLVLLLESAAAIAGGMAFVLWERERESLPYVAVAVFLGFLALDVVMPWLLALMGRAASRTHARKVFGLEI